MKTKHKKLIKAVESLLNSLEVRGLTDMVTAQEVLSIEEFDKFGMIAAMAYEVKQLLK